MKIDGQTYNFDIKDIEINLNEITLNNSVLQSIFNYFDTNNDKKLSGSELNNAFDEFVKMDKNSDKNTLSDDELNVSIKKYKQKVKNITANDLKMFMKELSITASSKDLAERLYDQISNLSLYFKTVNLLKEINNTNAAEVVSAYHKLANITLASDIDDEWCLDIDDVKKYVCKPLAEQAAKFGIKISNQEQYTNINDIKAINSYITKITKLIIDTKKQNQEMAMPFKRKTENLMKQKYKHSTKLLDIAQNNLGIIEVTDKEYQSMSEIEKRNTHMKIVGNYKGSINDAWCAYTVSYLAEKAGMKIDGAKSSVYKNPKNSWVSWAKKNKMWNNIPTKEMTKENYIKERAEREQAIKKQLNKMHEGDFIVWASQYIVSVEGSNEKFKPANASHIGIIEKVDVKKGIVTVIEGNANVFKQGRFSDNVIVSEQSGDPIGNQEYGEFREENLRDGLIRKEYTIKELAKRGYSGFIDNSLIIK